MNKILILETGKCPTRLWSLMMLISLMPCITLSQNKTNDNDFTPGISLSAGFGLVDLLNLAVRYQHEQTQIGISLGTLPVRNESLFSASGDVFFHFAGLSEFSDRRPWYVRTGLNYLKDETEYSIDKYTYLSLRLGRDLNFSNNAGIEIDAGPCFQLAHKTITKKPSWIDLEFPVIPTLGINLFYKF